MDQNSSLALPLYRGYNDHGFAARYFEDHVVRGVTDLATHSCHITILDRHKRTRRAAVLLSISKDRPEQEKKERPAFVQLRPIFGSRPNASYRQHTRQVDNSTVSGSRSPGLLLRLFRLAIALTHSLRDLSRWPQRAGISDAGSSHTKRLNHRIVGPRRCFDGLLLLQLQA